MRVSVALPFVTLCLLALVAMPMAAADEGPDATITMQADAPPSYEGPLGRFVLDAHEEGEATAWSMDIPEDYFVVDVRIPADLYDVDRPQQVMPWVDVAVDHYPLFNKFPRDDVWNVDGPAQVYRYVDDGDDTILRLGLRGPVNGTFHLERDTTAPTLTIGDVEDLVHFGYYQETRTDELARADLRIHAVDGDQKIEYPTPMFAYLQKFPVKGLDPETTYEASVFVTDWSGNNATSAPYTVTTPPRPLAPVPTLELRTPGPDTAGVSPTTPIEVGVWSPSPETVDTVRLFFDLKEIKDGWVLEGDTLTYTPPAPLENGPHRLSVEVYDIYGNMHHEQWTFTVGPALDGAEVPSTTPAMVLLALVGAAALVRRRCDV